ncbi:uncharacterized protein PGTG_08807 [Puccinia graminis f. sp. tritici CRL 75-36-700-3]|uniref:Uncharacterized protein n=1 Tax=Puccinia graminis f. sp. tritici (strain CRL 75-36-700-3 / race SCCL) TaxID=418459 RepID=E3KE78_PUCGT|nr:uncharacterized protein PGTG_08807 [Puccinia graminis f. sp. tritici CRL 75-36-700-3]EFP82611.1 hypothetical protein PGTG_08807 [Puccinia graminis f. sp. tritici CRL 75-36-700-3]
MMLLYKFPVVCSNKKFYLFFHCTAYFKDTTKMQKTQAFLWILLISILLEANTILAANHLMRQWRLRGDASGRVTSLPIIPNQDDHIIFSSDLETKEWKVENSSSEHSLLCKIRKSGTINWRVVQIIPPNSEIRTGIGMKKSIWSLRKMVLSFFMMLLVITPHALR